jgi:polyisoprenoid-binding protein YceI
MALLKRILGTFLRNLIGLAVMIAFIILVAFLPTAFSVRVPEPANASGGPRLQAIQLDKEWTITEESAAYMTVKSAGETVNFKFPQIQGYWSIDVAKPEQMKGVAVVPIQTADSGNALRDHALRSVDILNAEAFPEAKFELTSASSWPTVWNQKKVQRFILKGNLTLKGITKPIELDTEAK